jgi:hypothetical protein
MGVDKSGRDMQAPSVDQLGPAGIVDSADVGHQSIPNSNVGNESRRLHPIKNSAALNDFVEPLHHYTPVSLNTAVVAIFYITRNIIWSLCTYYWLI